MTGAAAGTDCICCHAGMTGAAAGTDCICCHAGTVGEIGAYVGEIGAYVGEIGAYVGEIGSPDEGRDIGFVANVLCVCHISSVEADPDQSSNKFSSSSIGICQVSSSHSF